jgi:hypothetical protein
MPLLLLSFGLRNNNRNKEGAARRAIMGAVTTASNKAGKARRPARINLNIVY